MTKIFLIPGLGADYRIYKNLEFQGYDIVNITWIEPNPKDTLADYAQKMIDHYHIQAGSIVVGNSLGGMLAIEIAKKLDLNKTLLISSIKTKSEAPKSHLWYRRIPLYKILPAGLFPKLGVFVKFAFGKMNKADQWLFVDMLEKTPPHFAKWALGAILHWDNQTIPQHVFHIHGNRDLVFPYRRLKYASILEGGSHIMVLNRPAEINDWIKSLLHS